MIDPNVKKILLMLTGAVDMLARGNAGDHEKVRQITSKVLNLIAEKPSKKKPTKAAPALPAPTCNCEKGHGHDLECERPEAAPTVGSVKFGASNSGPLLRSAHGDGWSASHDMVRLYLSIDLHGEDAGETAAKMLAPVGRGP